MERTGEDRRDGLFKLDGAQRKAFIRLKSAYRDCLRLGLVFYNNYGTLGAVDAERFDADFYNDTEKVGSVFDDGINMENEFRLECDSWAGDNHWFHPKKGRG